MTKPFIAILLVFIIHNSLFGESSWKEIMSANKALSRSDPLELFIDEQMQKIGIPLYTLAETIEKHFGLKYKEQPYVSSSYHSGFDGGDLYCICIDSGGFYIVGFAYFDDNDIFMGTGRIIFQLSKPIGLTCHKKKVLDISQTFLNKSSKVIRDGLKDVKIHERSEDFFLPSSPVFLYSKTKYFPDDTDKEWLLQRYVDFAFSESPIGIIDGYYMFMGFEPVRDEGQTLSDPRQ
ncbi:MAG: hypothetical protein LBC09_03500 [Helicobacteraceae bacterium]|nr:hypothetical protein [Helicobacteraceae bacterium]